MQPQEDHPGHAHGEGQDAEPAVDGPDGTFRDVDPHSLVTDGRGVDR